MDWLVRGNDATTNRPVALSLDEPDATSAARAAMERNIVVQAVTPAGARRMRWLVPALGAGALLFAVIAAGMYMQNRVLGENLQQAMGEQARLADSLARAQDSVADLQAHGNLATNAATQASRLAEELASARNRISLTEQQLTAARRTLGTLEEAADRVPALEKQLVATHEQLAATEKQLAAAREAAAGVQAELALRDRRLNQMQQLNAAENSATLAQLTKANQALSEQVDTLKKELLQLAAQSSGNVPEKEPDPAPAPGAWAMAIAYDTAKSFLALHSDPESIVTTSSGGMFSTSGAEPANAVRVQILHDRARERVYSVTLTVSLAADAPREKLEQNCKLIAEFQRTFAPSLKDDAAAVAAAQLSAQDASRRLVFLTAECRLTAWNNREGTYTFLAEASGQ